MKLGFIGLGRMGKPIALNLLKGAGTLTVISRTDREFEFFHRKGAACSTDIADVAEAAVIFLCLPNASVVRETILGSRGLLAHLDPGRMVIDLSTIDHGTTVELHRALETRDVAFLDAPVSGMEARAVDGSLTVMCGGTRDAFDTALPLLERIGDTILHMGPAGSGQLAKLVNQLLFDINTAALAEVLPMAVKMGLDPTQVGEVVNSGTGKSHASAFFIPRILARHFGDGYPMNDAYKDLVSGAELAARHCVPMPVLAAATATYQMALLRGHGRHDKGAMVQVYEELLGVRVSGGYDATHDAMNGDRP